MILTAAAVNLWQSRDETLRRVRSLALPLAYLPLLAVFLMTLVGTHVLIPATRR